MLNLQSGTSSLGAFKTNEKGMNEKMFSIDFSILVPIYNVETYLEECVNSVLNQTYSNWELILVDDGSSDSSGLLADRFSKIDPRIRVYHKDNRGLLHTRRYAIPLAKGEYCVFLDSDDSLEVNALETLYNYLVNTKYDCVIYGYKRVYDNGKELSRITEENIVLIEDIKQNALKLICNGEYNSLCRKAIKTQVLNKASREYDLSITQGEDLLQSIDVILNCESVLYIPEILYRYRMNFSSVSHTKNIAKQQRDIFKVRTYVLKKIQQSCVLNSEDYDLIAKKYYSVFMQINCMLSANISLENYKKTVSEYKNSVYFLLLKKYYSKSLIVKMVEKEMSALLKLYFRTRMIFVRTKHFIGSKLLK